MTDISVKSVSAYKYKQSTQLFVDKTNSLHLGGVFASSTMGKPTEP